MKSLFVDYKLLFPSLKLDLFHERYEEILNEYNAAQENIEFKDFTNEQNSYIGKCKKGYPITSQSYFSAKNRKINTNGWHVAAISVNGTPYPRNSYFLPTLVETVDKIGSICVCGINILDPNTKLDWHSDAEYSGSNKSFRCLWVLDSPEKDCIIQLKNEKTGQIETKDFQNNQIYAFYHHTIHRVENLSTKSRVAIAFDIAISSHISYD